MCRILGGGEENDPTVMLAGVEQVFVRIAGVG